MKKYYVYINNEKIKEYPTKIQAIIYLILKGYAYFHYRYGYWLNKKVRIEEYDN